MPGGDRTGPEGTGSRTGRGAGYCAGLNSPGYMNGLRPRIGMGLGRGGGRGFRFKQNAAPISLENEANTLRQNAQMLQNQLDQINSRLDELEKKSE